MTGLSGIFLAAVGALAPAAALLRELASEEAALALIGADKVKAATTCERSEVTSLMNLGWWSAARELILAGHAAGDRELQQSFANEVRKEAGVLKQRADALLLSLSDPRAKVARISCAYQWAQNSSAIFLNVKFAHRWTSPGALEVREEQVNVSSCCLNFSAIGDHSQLKKAYGLDAEFLHDVDPKRYSYSKASAGRLYLEIAKKEPKRWKTLLKTKERPKNQAVWDSMDTKWASEIKDFELQQKKKGNERDKDVLAEEEQQEWDAQKNKCRRTPSSPFRREPQVPLLCDMFWPPRMKWKGRGSDSTWLVLFFSVSEMQCEAANEAECKMKAELWAQIHKKLKDFSSALVGVVDCDSAGTFCKTQEVGHMPFVRRYRRGKRKAYYGEWDVDSVMKFVQEAEKEKGEKKKAKKPAPLTDAERKVAAAMAEHEKKKTEEAGTK